MEKHLVQPLRASAKDTYTRFCDLVRNRNYFAITTNVDHQFQRAGFSKSRLFYTQGDYGLWQRACHAQTYDNPRRGGRMVREQKDCRIPRLVPRCPVCGKPMAMNLRCDDIPRGRRRLARCAKERYARFLDAHETGQVLYLELGVGANTPVIIKYPFWRRVPKTRRPPMPA